MAILHNGLFGPVSGRIGNLVYFTRNGKCFVKSRPIPSQKEPTLRQLMHRERFKKAMAFIQPISDLINDTYKSINRKKTGMGVLLKQLLTGNLMGVYPDFEIDYPNLPLIHGRLPFSEMRMDILPGTQSVTLSWFVPPLDNLLNDNLVVLVHCPETGEWNIIYTMEPRSSGTCNFRPNVSSPGSEVHAWALFRSPDNRQCSASFYLGQLVTQTLDYHAN